MKMRTYTLIELLIVIAIVGLLLGVAIPAFVKMAKGTAVMQTTNQIVTKLNACRFAAMSKRQRAALVFPSTEATYWGGPARYGGSSTDPRFDALFVLLGGACL